MKHPYDLYTLEMIPAAVKRGRGRPRKANALSDAERARRYRQRQALKLELAIKMQGMNHGQIGKLRRHAERFGSSLEFSVLCEMTLKRMPFVPVTSS